MIDLTDPKGQIVEAALTLAAKDAWREITLLDIALAAGISLAELREYFAGKAEILSYFTRALDDAVIKKAPARADGESARDRLFEVVMNRFDAMAPYKTALKSIAGTGVRELSQVKAVLASQHWMLQAAGIGTDGARGGMRVAGLASVYAAVFRIWLGDDDAGLARTMAALDRRLRRGEAAMGRIDDACSGASDFASRLCGAIWPERSGPRSKPGADDGGAGGADSTSAGSSAGPAAPPAEGPVSG